MKRFPFPILFIILFGHGLVLSASTESEELTRPNILLIVSDDQGYADVSYHEHPEEVHTPNIDRLAHAGIQMTNGYVSGYVCSPTRAGLMTGRYQQRFGFYRAPDSRKGLSLNEITLPTLLKKAGYVTGAFGKWHLGLTKEFHPCSRGFDEFYGFLGHGGHDYFDLTYDEREPHSAIYRDWEIINDGGYLTDNLAREASSFIKRHKDKPFFLYLPFNAVHTPMQAPEEDIKGFNTGNKKRDILMAMLKRMDIAVGKVVDTLKDAGVYDNTLIFYFSDNGGARATNANNMPLKGSKHTFYEGGIRVPFIVSWPKVLEPGKCDEPVISLDVLPTLLKVVGQELPADREYDGRDIMPVLLGEMKNKLHEQLFWDGAEGTWAVREGKWKLINSKSNDLELYDLSTDISEAKNLSGKHPELVSKLEADYRSWRAAMAPYETFKKKKKKKKKK